MNAYVAVKIPFRACLISSGFMLRHVLLPNSTHSVTKSVISRLLQQLRMLRKVSHNHVGMRYYCAQP
jgi:arginine repressor